MRTVHVKASKEYDIHIGDGILASVGEKVRPLLSGEKAALITDDNVDALYACTVEDSLKAAGIECRKFVFAHGEASKNIATLTAILEFLAENRFRRNDMIAALGGGVVGDIAGFAAATYMRGVGYVQIPTTLLAAVDASVGGKTGVDLEHGKNLAGAFWQPSLVICDCDVLRALPEEIFANGMAEVIKCGVIRDEKILECIENGMVFEELKWLIERCVTIKRDIVEQDEFDTSVRQLLNFGHTVGHAIEKLSNYTVPHGHAVAIGMVYEVKLAERIGICDTGLALRLMNILSGWQFRTHTDYDDNNILNTMYTDKKNMDGRIAFAFPARIGRCDMYKLSDQQIIDRLGDIYR